MASSELRDATQAAEQGLQRASLLQFFFDPCPALVRRFFRSARTPVGLQAENGSCGRCAYS